MSETHDGAQPGWMKLNPHVDHFDSFEDIGILQGDEVRHLRYGISLCNHNLLFDKTTLCEASLKTDVYPIPNVPSWIHGMMNLRGNIIPVFRIDEFLTDSKEPGKANNVVLIIGEGNDAAGLSISALPVAVEIDEENVNTVPIPDNTPDIFSDCVNRAYDVDDKTWLEIDIDAVLGNIKYLEKK